MATLTAAELRNLGRDELMTKLGEAKEELFNLRFQAATGQLESHGRLRAVRKDIARIYTVLSERALGSPRRSTPRLPRRSPTRLRTTVRRPTHDREREGRDREHDPPRREAAEDP
jgi:large subunit ribosomal protein L29